MDQDLVVVNLSVRGIAGTIQQAVHLWTEERKQEINERIELAVKAFDIDKVIQADVERLLRDALDRTVERVTREAGGKVSESTKLRVRELVLKELADASDDRNDKLREKILEARLALLSGDVPRALLYLESNS